MRMGGFFISQVLIPGLRFGGIDGVDLVLAVADLNSGETVLYGPDGDLSISDCLLDSITMPPWIMPNEREDHLLMDGRMISSLPIEPA